MPPGLATMDIYENENLFERANNLSGYFLDAIFKLQEYEIVTDVRGYGLIAGLDFAPSGIPGSVGISIQKKLFHEGLHVKTTGEAAIIAPPLVSTEEHIDEIVEKFRSVLENY